MGKQGVVRTSRRARRTKYRDLPTSVGRAQRVLIVAAMGEPPYTGGVETVVDTLLKSGLSGQFDQSVHDIYNPPSQTRGPLAKLTNAVRLVCGTALAIVRERPRIVHIHSAAGVSFMRAALCLLVARMLFRTTVFHLHGGDFDTEYWQAGRRKRRVIEWIFRRAHHVIALSEYWQDFLSLFVPSDRVAILNNPIPCESLGPQAEPERNRNVLLIGSLGRRKGHFDVLDAVPKVIEKFPDCRFLFAGLDEYIGARSELEALVAERGLNPHVDFLGPVTGDAKLDLLHSSGVLILPSYGENMPMTVLEGMAAEMPVVASDVGAVPEVIEHGEHGLLMKAGDTDTLVSHICEVLATPEEAQRMGRAARRKAQSTWDVSAITQKLASLYRSWMKLEAAA